MKSITLKLVLAFLGISLISIVLIVLLTRWRTKEEFTRFLSHQNQTSLVTQLTDYYRQHDSWEGVIDIVPQVEIRSQVTGEHGGRIPMTLVDNAGNILLAGPGYQIGDEIGLAEIDRGIPIQVNNARLGTLLIGRTAVRSFSAGSAFLERANRILLYSASGAAALALLMGVFISRTLTRPIRELTAATRVVSGGNLAHEVTVRSRDELGQLAASFNRMSAELARSLNLRRQMTADIAHELRTPISVILGYTEAVHDGVLAPTLDTFEIIREEAERLNRLVEDLRLLSRADAGELPLDRQPANIQNLLEEVRSIHSHRASHKSISLEMQTASDLPIIEVDHDRMVQVLSNLLDNALRFTPEGGRILLTADRVGENLEIRVQDNGPGLDEEELTRIFDRFYRADTSRQRGEGGSGLGLAIAKSLVEQHAGRIWAEGKQSKGLTFIIQLRIMSE